MSFLRNSLVVVLVVVCVAPSQAQQLPDFVKIGEIIQRCRQQTGATNEDIQSIFMRKVPETRSGQCMLACAGEGLGVMRQGRLDTDGTLAIAGRLTQGRNQRIQDAVRNGILTCAQESAASGIQDNCAAAAQLANCGVNTAHRVSTNIARVQGKLKSSTSSKPTLNGVENGDLDPSTVHPMKTLHSKSSSHYSQTNERIRRQSGNNVLGSPNQPIPYVSPVQQYPIQQNPSQQYPLQTNPINPIDQSLLQTGRAVNPVYNYPYSQPYVQPYPYVQPFVVTTPLLRRKRSPQEILLTESEIDLPPEVVHQISERLRELLSALILSQDGQSLNSTDVTEKDAEFIESITSSPRKRRQAGQDNQQESPLGQLLDIVRKGPIHQIMHDLRSIVTEPTSQTNGTTSSTPAPATTA